VRQYADLKDQDKKLKDEKIERLTKLRAIFEEAHKKAGEIKFYKARGDKKGANSSEIKVCFFDKNSNTLELVTKHLPILHNEFLLGLNESGLYKQQLRMVS